MPKPLPVFHIGANKAGSTTLQRALFACHSQVRSLYKPTPVLAAKNIISEIMDHCDSRSESIAPPDFNSLRKIWQRCLKEDGGDAAVPVFSNEELIRYCFYGPPDPERLPRSIKELTGPLRVIIVTRNQIRLIESLYVHKSNTSEFLPVTQWLENNPQWLKTYCFHDVADAWAKVVGEENVGVFAFEELARDHASFARRLCNFIGIDTDEGVRLLANQHENIRKSARTQTYAQLRSVFLPNASLGRLFPGSVRRIWRNYLDSGPRSQIELPPDWQVPLEERYCGDNRKLANRFGVPLEDFGYPF